MLNALSNSETKSDTLPQHTQTFNSPPPSPIVKKVKSSMLELDPDQSHIQSITPSKNTPLTRDLSSRPKAMSTANDATPTRTPLNKASSSLPTTNNIGEGIDDIDPNLQWLLSDDMFDKYDRFLNTTTQIKQMLSSCDDEAEDLFRKEVEYCLHNYGTISPNLQTLEVTNGLSKDDVKLCIMEHTMNIIKRTQVRVELAKHEESVVTKTNRKQ